MNNQGDKRVVNNVMHHESRALTSLEKELVQTVKDQGLEFWLLCNSVGQSRELILAKTKIEEAVMWAVKHITG